MAEQFGLKGFEGSYPHLLSGGMRQRVAFLRTALANQDVILLDEPFGALDALTRANMQEWLLRQWESWGKTIVLVTHDVDEAVLLSDRVYVLTPRPGTLKMVMPVDLPPAQELRDDNGRRVCEDEGGAARGAEDGGERWVACSKKRPHTSRHSCREETFAKHGVIPRDIHFSSFRRKPESISLYIGRPGFLLPQE